MKRAQVTTQTLLVVLVLLLVAAVIFISFQTRLFGLAEAKSAKDVCKTSVYANALLGRSVGIFSSDIKCPTQYLQIDNSDVAHAKFEIAKALSDCWEQFGEGRLELFSGEGVFCSVCHLITFKHKEKAISGLLDYLATNKKPLTDKSYLDYLTSYHTSGSEVLKAYAAEKLPPDILDPSRGNTYATIFYYVKGKDHVKDVIERAQAAAPGIGLEALGIGLIKAGSATAGLISATGIGAPLGVVVAKVSTIVGGVLIVGGAGYALLAGWFGGVPVEFLSQVRLEPYNEQTLKNLGCQILPAAEKAEVGR
ncbi:MAG: hypothetical protein QXU88_00930 [Candidatus Woesearchaeota archaeon]